MRVVSYSPFAPRFRSAVRPSRPVADPFAFGPGFRLFDSLLADRVAPEADYDYEALDENRYRLTLNAAGFEESELAVESQGDLLTVEGKSEDGRRQLKRSFRLGEHMEVTGAALEKGLLSIEIERIVPEALKPKRIEIGSAGVKGIAGKAKKLVGGAKKAA